MSTPKPEPADHYCSRVGVLAIAAALLIYAALAARLLSATMPHVLILGAVSIALLGLPAGAMLVHLLPRRFTPQHAPRQFAGSALLFAGLVFLSMLVYLVVRPAPTTGGIAAAAAVLFIPLVFGGVCLGAAASASPRHVSQFCATAFGGAALGCLIVAALLPFADARALVVLSAVVAAGGAATTARAARAGRLLARSLVCAGLLTLGSTLFISPTRGKVARPPYEDWTSFSHVRVEGGADPSPPRGPGLSPVFGQNYPDHKVCQTQLTIDGSASTDLTFFNGDLAPLSFLKYDVANLAYYLRNEPRILIIGPTGGREVLSALAFHYGSVRIIQPDSAVSHAVNDVFGQFTGHLDRLPKSRFINADARTYLAGCEDDFDLIRVALTDTWPATNDGTLTLNETPLHTREAWKMMLSHLGDDGLLTVSGWHHTSRPAETHRVVALAAACLRDTGVRNPRAHLLMVCTAPPSPDKRGPDGIATLIVSRQPLSALDLRKARAVIDPLHFKTLLSPSQAADPVLARLATGAAPTVSTAGRPLDLSAPTDDKPFFHNFVRPRDVLTGDSSRPGRHGPLFQATCILGAPVMCVIVFMLVTVLATSPPQAGGTSRRPHWPLALFFIAIGLASTLVAISQMQRLTILLGHAYRLPIVVCALLASAALGSLSMRRLDGHRARPVVWRILALLAILVAIGLVTPPLARIFQSQGAPLRIAVALALLCPAGFCVGVIHSLGMKAAARNTATSAWPLSISLAAAACGPLLALLIAVIWGFSIVWWTGVASCSVAALCLRLALPKPTEAELGAAQSIASAS